MTRGAKWGFLGLICMAVTAEGCSGCAKPPPVPLDVPEHTGPLVFPPADDGWHDRQPMRGGMSGSAIHAYEPKLDDAGRFEVNGQTVALSFDDDLFAESELKAAPLVTITPSVPGRTVWLSSRTVEYRADKPFDAAVDYTATLPEMTGPRGRKLVGGFKGTFRANPELTIAGKIIHYVPKPGEPRVVYVRPVEDREIGPAQELIVIYDQPIEIAAAAKLLSLSDDKGQKRTLSLAHPPAGGTFEGEKVDTKSIVLAKMTPPPAPDTKLAFVAASANKDVEPTRREFQIPKLPKLETFGCSDPQLCDVKGNVIHGPVTTGLKLHFSNRVRGEDLEKHLRVTPTPPRLRIGGWGEDAYVDATFAPSTTYQISSAGLKDRYGFPVADVAITFTTYARSSSAILREGVMVLDETAAHEMFVTTRNVSKGELLVWSVPPGAESLVTAMKSARNNDPPTTFGPPLVIPFDGAGGPHTYAKAPLDLWGKLEPGHSYLAQARVKEPSNGAAVEQTDRSYASSKPSVPLFVVAGRETVGAHVHTVDRQVLVSVFRLATGEPVSGATVGMGSARSTTDDKGVAQLEQPATHSEAEAVTIKVGAEETIVPLDKISTGAGELYPELTAGDYESRPHDGGNVLGVLVTDRGIYRPGSKIFVKGVVRKADDKRIAAVPQAKVRLRVIDATGSDFVDEALTTSALGTVTREVALPKTQRNGIHRIRLELDDAKHTVLVEESVRVADFETPRFKVDVEASPDMPAGRWKSRVIGRYFFGAPMDAGRVEWTLKKKKHPIEAKALTDAGFTFDKESDELDSYTPKKEERPRTGDGKLRPDGTFDVDVELGDLAAGPTDVTFEADVSDSSYRHVAGRKTITRFPFPRYAGLRVGRRFGAVGPVKVNLAVVDKDGRPIAGAPAEARLERLEWKKSSQKAESGAVVETWGAVATVEGTCALTTDSAPKSCDLVAKRSGDYRVVARVDGRDDASTSFYAWGGEGDGGAVPSTGKKVPIAADKKSYQPGETAKVLVQSPFPEAMAVLTVERGGLLAHETKRFKGASTVFDVPLELAHAPYAHAVVTLLPINGGPEATYRVGALRLPVALDNARLTVKVTSAKKSYDARETADITIEVKRGSELLKNADVTLAVVDEAILRLTDFHAKDPTAALHPPRPLAFTAADSRQLLFRRREKAHVAGGGGGEGPDSFDTRMDFVETAAWLPSLVTDSSGKATASVKLPDNLTEFRMMATVIGEDGSAGASESSFVVTRPFLLDPILPSFALVGDKLEIAAMAHNNTDSPVNAKVTILGQKRDIRIGAQGHERVSTPMVADKTTPVSFALEVDGKIKDKVEKVLRIGLPGTEEHPQLAGVFRQSQEITLAVPDDAIFEDGAKLTLRTGAALYPELGQRLAFLREYPHGCAEQTTSGTLPLLAARNLLPWTGVVSLDDDELRKRIDAGVKRLATMKTASGGLAFWPGGKEPHVYGTTYAALALLGAKAIGIEEEGLLPGVLGFLEEQLPRERDPVMKVAIAELLAQAGRLKADSFDALYDVRGKLDAYGLGSLALALSTQPNEAERTKSVLDALEASFDDTGIVKESDHGNRDYVYWGSSDRDRAQALIALTKLRPTSKLSTTLAHRLIRSLDRYSTQSTAWSLMALSAFVGNAKPNGAVDVKIRAEGFIFDTTRRLGGDNKEVTIPLADLRGKKVKLLLEGDANTPSAFSMEARFVRPDSSSTRNARRAALGPSVYRVFTSPSGAPINLAAVKAGDVVRVALRIELPKLDAWRASYLAVTDRLAGGFQPIQPDLATVAAAPELQKEHPFYEGLTSWGGEASHVDVRDNRVNIYFDHVYGGTAAYATYLMRATTPGEFMLPAARAELMYEPGSEGYSEGGRVTIR